MIKQNVQQDKPMERPQEYFAIHKETKEVRYFNHYELKPYRPLSDNEYKWDVYIDTRYKAKLRLYNYIHKIKPTKHRPFAGTEIGKSIPILNF